MEFPDLYKFPAGHPPSPYERPVRVLNVGEVYLPEDNELFAIGWIEDAGFPPFVIGHAVALQHASDRTFILEGLAKAREACTREEVRRD